MMGPLGYDNSNNYRPARSRGGCSSRFLIALAIAAIGFFSYLTNTEENPVTGEHQRVAMSPAQEIQLGLQSAPQMAAQMGGDLPANDPRTQLVQKMGTYLVQHTIAAKSPWKFQFHLLADKKTINAFALPGGQIFITVGLLDKLGTEAQLAGVLAHEMGHVIERHSAEHLAKGQLGQMLVLATGVGASDGGSNRGYHAAMIANVVNQMTQMRFGRQDELEADQWGLRLTEEAGYTPVAMIEVMKILEKAGGRSGKQPEMFMTHPNPGHRIEEIEAYLKKHPPNSQLTEGKNLQDLLNRS